MHSYSVEFRIVSESADLDLKAITENLGLTATNTRSRGEAKSASRVFSESMWGCSVYPNHSDKDWDSLEEALVSLLNIFTPLKDKIKDYIRKYKVVIWCGHFTSSFDGGPLLSSDTLKKLGDLGVELYLDTYCSTESAKGAGQGIFSLPRLLRLLTSQECIENLHDLFPLYVAAAFPPG